MFNIITSIVAIITICIFWPFVAIMIWKDLHGDKNWALRMWVRYVMKEVPRESEDDIVSLLKRNVLDER